jgi:hypothetical protein
MHRLVEGKSHTSFLLEGPMSGGRDLLMDLVLPLLMPGGVGGSGGLGAAGRGDGGGNSNRYSSRDGLFNIGGGGGYGGYTSTGGGGGDEAVPPPTTSAPRYDQPVEYPQLCPAILCRLAGMVCPF